MVKRAEKIEMKKEKIEEGREENRIVLILVAVALSLLILPNISASIQNLSYDSGKNTINTSYDSKNRILNQTGDSDWNKYFYDVGMNDTITNISNDDNVAIKYEYDNKKRVIKETKEIDGLIFERKSSFDSFDRPVNLYGSMNTMNFTYGNNSLVSAILNVISSIFYNEQKQPLNKTYNNNLATNFTYYVNFRLKEIKTGNKQGLFYSYDNAGNVKNINDTANLRVYSMSYDNLNRLISADIKNNANSSDNPINYNYNSIGNILNSTSPSRNLTYYYGQTRVHAPISIDDGASSQLIDVYNLTHLNTQAVKRLTFGFFIQNLNSSTMNNISWNFNTGQSNITSVTNSTLISNKSKYVIVEYEYQGTGIENRTVIATASSNGISDSESIEVIA